MKKLEMATEVDLLKYNALLEEIKREKSSDVDTIKKYLSLIRVMKKRCLFIFKEDKQN